MPTRATTSRSMSNWTGSLGNMSEWMTGRNMMIFGAGAALMLAASRIAPPFAGRAIGTMRAISGTDPFDALAQDHQKVLGLFGRIEETENTAVTRRSALLLQLKRMLTAHALAEEDIVYPMLHDDAHRTEQAKKLYNEHAMVKVKLFELEHKAKDDPTWIDDLRALHRMVAEHVHEEEQIEFPKLRAALDQSQCTNLLGEVSREKSMLL
jgi:hemerythrin superfamily protein